MREQLGVPLRHLNYHSAVINLDGQWTHLQLLPALPQLHNLLHPLFQHNAEHGVVSASSCEPHEQLAAFANNLGCTADTREERSGERTGNTARQHTRQLQNNKRESATGGRGQNCPKSMRELTKKGASNFVKNPMERHNQTAEPNDIDLHSRVDQYSLLVGFNWNIGRDSNFAQQLSRHVECNGKSVAYGGNAGVVLENEKNETV